MRPSSLPPRISLPAAPPRPPSFEGRQGLSIDETCQVMGIGRTLLYELMDSGIIKTKKIGTRRIVLVSSVTEFMREPVEGGRCA